ncbi:hypothetical protein C0J52_00796 [Blattella germanica]|nr:hypothetical protein C0J52_00796 [Blattella germanica]
MDNVKYTRNAILFRASITSYLHHCPRPQFFKRKESQLTRFSFGTSVFGIARTQQWETGLTF